MCDADITSYLEPIEFLLDLREAGYAVYPTGRGVLACPPPGVVMPAEMRLTLCRTEPFVRDLLIHEGLPVLSDAEAARVAGDPGADHDYRFLGRRRRRWLYRERAKAAPKVVLCST